MASRLVVVSAISLIPAGSGLVVSATASLGTWELFSSGATSVVFVSEGPKLRRGEKHVVEFPACTD